MAIGKDWASSRDPAQFSRGRDLAWTFTGVPYPGRQIPRKASDDASVAKTEPLPQVTFTISSSANGTLTFQFHAHAAPFTNSTTLRRH
jgi:hypothetical protein